jgi:hypothetical protein
VLYTLPGLKTEAMVDNADRESQDECLVSIFDTRNKKEGYEL